MKADIYGMDGKKSKSINLPKQFTESIRPDLIRKANNVAEANSQQPYGAFLGAGIRAAAEMSRRRKAFKGSYGHGMSRVPRKHSWRRGTQFGYTGAFAPGTVSGRKAHPPKADQDRSKSINKNERRLAIRSAISSTIIADLVTARGHRFENLISVVDNKVESLNKTKDVEALLLKLNLKDELARISVKKVRAGRGTMRNRKYKTKKGPLFVVSKNCPLTDAASNMLGVDVCEVRNLNVRLLAPGGQPGRMTLFSEEAINLMEKNKLFFKTIKKETKPKVEKKTKETKK
ncbi:50S ribosomal protein L4 [Candidatus Woesearchaeota archaeon]|nr:50S ribosomal protein L4 [Candidatus Woesearchaeota archaeon]MBT5215115.1 50S ribosomal protein L4 [Candidatus Woesearchaeota archaeon]MBT6402540.1 50S ribosomal protein L4 [Candidatus Woesearchaeota archaeon]